MEYDDEDYHKTQPQSPEFPVPGKSSWVVIAKDLDFSGQRTTIVVAPCVRALKVLRVYRCTVWCRVFHQETHGAPICTQSPTVVLQICFTCLSTALYQVHSATAQRTDSPDKQETLLVPKMVWTVLALSARPSTLLTLAHMSVHLSWSRRILRRCMLTDVPMT